MNEDKISLRKLAKRIKDGEKTAESYGTGLAQEKVIVSAYNTMTIKQLEQLRYILNQIIKKKKIFKRIQKNDSPNIG